MMHRSTDATHERTGRRLWCGLALLLAVLSAGCGGSGSSGFDAVAAENAAIDRALAGQACEVEGGLTICPSNGAATPPSPPPSFTPTPTASPDRLATATTTPLPIPSRTATGTGLRTATPTPTPTGSTSPMAPTVDVGFDSEDVATCAQVAIDQPCILTVTFQPGAAPDDAVYAVAARDRDPDSPWRLLPVSGNRALVVVEPGVDTVQVAILLYAGDPGALPEEVDLLADSGADFAFVTAAQVVRGGTAP